MPTRTYELEVPLTYVGGLPLHTRLKMILVGSQSFSVVLVGSQWFSVVLVGS